MKAWIYDSNNTSADPRQLNQLSPNIPVSVEELAKVGVLYFKIDADQPGFIDEIEALCKERSYKNRDEVIL